LRGTRADYQGPAWRAGESFFGAFLGEWAFGDGVVTQWNDADAVLWWARLPMLLLTLALGGVLWVHACRLGGPWAGLLCVVAYATAPVFLAFGPLVLTDIAITLFSLVTLWQTAELWRDPSARNIRFLGLAFGGAVLSKFSAGILLLAVLAFAIATRRWPVAGQPAAGPERKAWRRLRWRGLRRSFLVAALVVYAVYFLFSWNQPRDIPIHAPAFLIRLLMPIWILLRGLLFFVFTSSRPTFLLGQWHPRGVWFYFPSCSR
jgi:4-amino-4-deoxy-L-arabinose transferase-like glycosyltransferase